MLHIRGEAALDEGQLLVLTIVTRVASTLSALGVLTIIATYCVSKHFRNPMHRLIFINSFYNALDVTCTMISTSGPAAGNSSALCQFQGFLNQMFPIADVLWTMAMAINVYLIVYRSYDVESLRRLEWKYMAGITTVTFIPALTFLFIHSDENGRMYGSVTLWCAIAPKWVLFRIVLYYVPIWSSILITIALYLLVGIEIAKRRRILRSISSQVNATVLDETLTTTAHHRYNHFDSHSNSTTAEGDYTTNSSSSSSSTHPRPHPDSTPNPTPTASRSPGNDGASSDSSDSNAPTTNIKPTTYAASTTTTATTTRILPANPSTLSFRQYILLPLFFFLALLLVWVAPTTNRVAAAVAGPGVPAPTPYALLLAVGAAGSLRGFWNGVVFVVVGMRSWRRGRRREEEDRVALRAVGGVT